MDLQTTIVLREAEACDLSALSVLERTALAPGWTATQLRDVVEDPRSLVLVAGNRDGLSGYVSYRWVLDEAELLRLAVHPEAQRRGVARRLTREAESRLRTRGVEFFHLEVRDDNPRAIAFYKAEGWRPAGRRRCYYLDGVDALLLRKE